MENANRAFSRKIFPLPSCDSHSRSPPHILSIINKTQHQHSSEESVFKVELKAFGQSLLDSFVQRGGSNSCIGLPAIN